MPFARRIALLTIAIIVVACSWLAPFDSPATAQVDAGLKRALVSFATARALHAVVSVVQGTEIDIQPAGIGATLAPGQLLAPVNDLVKHFADLMLMASVAFGIQKVLIGISSYWAISLALSLAAAAWVGCHLLLRATPFWLSKMLVVLLMLRFAVPLVTLGSEALSQRYLASDYTASQDAMARAAVQTAKARPPDPATPEQPSGTLDKLRSLLPKVPDFKARFEEMRHVVEQATDHVVKLMVIFVLQTVVMPLLLLWGLYTTSKAVVMGQSRRPFMAARVSSTGAQDRD